jgi:hypothetical protein
MCCRHRDYADRVPEDAETFMGDLAAFYTGRGADLPDAVVQSCSEHLTTFECSAVAHKCVLYGSGAAMWVLLVHGCSCAGHGDA